METQITALKTDEKIPPAILTKKRKIFDNTSFLSFFTVTADWELLFPHWNHFVEKFWKNRLTAMLMPPKRPPFPASRFRFAISAICSFRCFFAASSCDFRIAIATWKCVIELKKAWMKSTFSSCDSISVKTRIWLRLTDSRYPRATISSKAKRSSNALLETSVSSIVLEKKWD